MGHDGIVESIGMRSTKIRLLSGHLTSIPNEKVAVTDVENIGRRPYIRRVFNITITYDSPPEKINRALEILSDILAVPETAEADSATSSATSSDQPPEEPHPNEAINQPDFPPRIYFNQLNADSLNVLVYYWYHPAEIWDYLQHATWVNLQIVERFNAEGIDFALPTQTIHLAGDEHRSLTVGQHWVSTEATGSPNEIQTQAAGSGAGAAVMEPPSHFRGSRTRAPKDPTSAPLEDELMHGDAVGEGGAVGNGDK